MAAGVKVVLVPIDLSQNELRNVAFQVLANDPASPVVGQVWYNSTQGQLKIHNGVDNEVLVDNAQLLQGNNGAYYLSRANHTGTQALGTITGHDKAAHDALGIDAATVGGATPANLRDRATHTGTQVASTISDFDTQVRTSRLDQMAAPTAAVSLNGQKITGLATPTADSDAATKAYVDGVGAGLDFKDSVRAATTANVNLATGGLLTVDGVVLADGDRVLVKAQTDPAQNGIYVASTGTWARATDADTIGELNAGAFTFIEEGTAHADQAWVISNQPATLGTDPITWTQFAAPGSITAGGGLTKTGDTLAVGQGTGIVVGADDVSIDTTVVARKFSADVGNGAATAIAVVHNLGTRDVSVTVRQAATPFAEVVVDVEHTDANTVTVYFADAPTANEFRVTVIG